MLVRAPRLEGVRAQVVELHPLERRGVRRLQQDRRIAWQTVLAGPLGRFIGGRIWRYELEQTPEGTKVTETWDITQDKQRFLLQLGTIGRQTAEAMSKTLDRLAQLSEGSESGS